MENDKTWKATETLGSADGFTLQSQNIIIYSLAKAKILSVPAVWGKIQNVLS